MSIKLQKYTDVLLPIIFNSVKYMTSNARQHSAGLEDV